MKHARTLLASLLVANHAGFLFRDADEWQKAAERIVSLYAWNEFGEGGYLAPTRGDPDGAYLKAVKQVVQPHRPVRATER